MLEGSSCPSRGAGKARVTAARFCWHCLSSARISWYLHSASLGDCLWKSASSSRLLTRSCALLSCSSSLTSSLYASISFNTGVASRVAAGVDSCCPGVSTCASTGVATPVSTGGWSSKMTQTLYLVPCGSFSAWSSPRWILRSIVAVDTPSWTLRKI